MARFADDSDRLGRSRPAGRELVALAIALAATICFAGIAAAVMPGVIRASLGLEPPPNLGLVSALLLNIALILLGWRRYRDLQQEVRQRRLAEAEALRMADIDPLTGCLNRRSGMPAIAALRADAAAQGQAVAVLMIDFDNFKNINDMHGHRAGDAVLVELAGRIHALLPAGGVLVRIGGDEFACAIAFDGADRAGIDHFAASLIDAVSAPVETGDAIVKATISIGIASEPAACTSDGPPCEAECEAVVHQADIAMYHAKQSGRNRSVWFEPEMASRMRARQDLERGIREGIRAGQFVPYYEQQVDLESGAIVGFEMLARWHSPQFGEVSPEVFIPIAEELELIGELSENLIRQALADANQWDPKLTLSVNISPVQLRDPWFAQKLLKLLADSGFPPARLEIEITESCLHENVAMVRTIATALKNQGIQISLDDFGTGYSSLSQLRALPFDRIKIDRSFIRELPCGEEQNNLVRAIVSLGRGLSLPLTAEGVETEAVLDALRGMGPLKGQGYHYGHPESAEQTRLRLEGLGLLASSPRPKTPPAPPARNAPPAHRRKAG